MSKRKVVERIDADAVAIENVDCDMIYAAKAHDDGHILLITKIMDSRAGEIYVTVWPYADRMDNHNYEASDLSQIVEQMLNDGYEIYEFEEDRELAKWIMEIF